jgi:hypothetical protein
MRGALQATLGRLPSTRRASRPSGWLTVLARPRRQWSTERIEAFERLNRQRREALSRGAEHPEFRWLRRY